MLVGRLVLYDSASAVQIGGRNIPCGTQEIGQSRYDAFIRTNDPPHNTRTENL